MHAANAVAAGFADDGRECVAGVVAVQVNLTLVAPLADALRARLAQSFFQTSGWMRE